MKEKHGLAEKIAKTLDGVCPAFHREGRGPATWHQCHCSAEPGAFRYFQPCVCVWHLTDSCVAGKWPQLAFICQKADHDATEAATMLELAKQACK